MYSALGYHGKLHAAPLNNALTRPRLMTDLEKQFIGLLKTIESERRLDRVFFDFVEMAAIAISNSVDRSQFAEREAIWKETSARYTKDENRVFGKCLGLLTKIMDQGFGDHLGQLYMSLDLGNDRLGQHFSPYDLSRLTATLTLDEKRITSIVGERGFITLNEPTTGGGGMIIAAAHIFKDMGFNPQRHLHVTCQDVDITAVYMTYLQLSLFGIPAVVIHGDVLKLEERSHWYTPFHIMHGWSRRLRDTPEPPPKYEELVTKCEELTTPLSGQPEPAPQLVLF